MAKSITLELRVKTDLQELNTLQAKAEELAGNLSKGYTQAFEQALEATQSWFASTSREIEKTVSGWGEEIRTMASSSLEGAFSNAIRGELDKAEDILHGFGDRLEANFRSLGERLATGLMHQLYSGLEALAQKFVINPLQELVGQVLGGVGEALGQVVGWLGNLGKIFLPSTSELGSMLGGWLSEGAGIIAPSAQAMMRGSEWATVVAQATSTAGPTLAGIAGAGAGAGGATLGAEWAAINAEIEGAQAGAAGVGMGTLGAVGAGLAMWGGLELFASLTGTKGPTQALTEAVGSILGLRGEGGYSPMEALAELNSRMNFLLRQIEQLGTLDLSWAGELASKLGMLAERAGIGKEGLEKLIQSLDPLKAKLVEAAQAMGEAGRKIDLLIEEAVRLDSEMSATVSGAEMLRQRLMEMAEAMGLPENEAKELREAIEELVDAWQQGNISAEALAESLKNRFARALEHVAHSAGSTVGQIHELIQAIHSIPTHWESEIGIRVSTRGGGGLVQGAGGPPLALHTGGLVPAWARYHSGARVSPLGPEEIPIIAQRGEFVVRTESVTPATLPWLEALNRTGRVPLASPAVVINAPLVEVQGHALAGEEGLEELARIIEEKLADLAEVRVQAEV